MLRMHCSEARRRRLQSGAPGDQRTQQWGASGDQQISRQVLGLRGRGAGNAGKCVARLGLTAGFFAPRTRPGCGYSLKFKTKILTSIQVSSLILLSPRFRQRGLFLLAMVLAQGKEPFRLAGLMLFGSR